MSDSDGGYQYNINNTDDDAPGLEMMSNSDIDEDDKYVEDEQTREMMAALADVLLDGFLKNMKKKPRMRSILPQKKLRMKDALV